MKVFVVFIFILTVFSFSFSQDSIGVIYPSSCDANQSVRDLYKYDAYYFTYHYSQEIDTTYKDSVNIDFNVYERILNALIAVYNVEGLPESDTVTRILDLHQFPKDQYCISIYNSIRDYSVPLPLAEDIINGIFPTSNQEFNDVVLEYNFQIYGESFRKDYAYKVGPIFIYSFKLTYNEEIPLNLRQIAESRVFPIVWDYMTENGEYITFVSTFENSAPLSITCDYQEDYIDLVYVYRYNIFNHPYGEEKSRRWHYRVYDDCQVEYRGVEGDPFELITDYYMVFPNPFKDKITITGIKEDANFKIYNNHGVMVKSGKTFNRKITDLSELHQGFYFMDLEFKNGDILQFKLMKY